MAVSPLWATGRWSGGPNQGTGLGSQAIETPSIVLSSSSGGSDTYIQVTGANFPGDTQVNLTTINPAVPLYNVSYPTAYTTNASGGFIDLYFLIEFLAPATYEVLATDGGLSATATYTVTSSSIAFWTYPTATAPAGGSTTVNGTGWYPGDEVYVYLGDATQVISIAQVDASGTGVLASSVAIPLDVVPGVYVLFAQGLSLGYGGVVFTVTPPPPSITLDPTQGALGSTVSVTGTYFASDSPISLTATPNNNNGVSIPICAGTTSDSNGGFSCTFTDPSASGNSSDTIAATDDAADSASTVFTIISPALSLTLGAGQPGQTLGVTGVGFPTDTEITVPFGSTGGSCSAMTSSSGAFSCSLAVPLTNSGDVSVSGQASGVTYATREFDVQPFPSTRFPAYFFGITIPGQSGYLGTTTVDGAKNFYEALNWTLTSSGRVSMTTSYSLESVQLMEIVLKGMATFAKLHLVTYFAGEDPASPTVYTAAQNDSITYSDCTGVSAAQQVTDQGPTTVTVVFDCAAVSWSDQVASSADSWATNTIQYTFTGTASPGLVASPTQDVRAAADQPASGVAQWYLSVAGETHLTGYEVFDGREQMYILNYSLFGTPSPGQVDFNVTLRATVVNDLFLISVEKGDLRSLTLRGFGATGAHPKLYETLVLTYLSTTGFYETGSVGQAPSLWESFTAGEWSITT